MSVYMLQQQPTSLNPFIAVFCADAVKKTVFFFVGDLMKK